MAIKPWIGGAGFILALAGCASVADPANAVSGSSAIIFEQTRTDGEVDPGALPPQELDLGECGVFFWNARADRRFLAFENLTTGLARIHVDGQMREFLSSIRAEPVAPGVPFVRRFTNPTLSLDIELSGDVEGGVAAGFRIAPARMRLLQPDGGQVVIPLIGHYACRVER